MRFFLLPILLLLCLLSYAQDTAEQDTCVLFSLTEMDITVGDSACTFITVSNFEHLLSFQFSLQYDDTVLEFGNCALDGAINSFNCSDIALQDDGPLFKALWFEPLGNLTTLEDETPIAQLCFLVIAEPTAGQILVQFTDDLSGEAAKGDPNDLSVAEKFPFCSQDDITSNVLDMSQNSELSIFPNPATDVLFIENNDDSFSTEQISIYNVNGQLIVVEKQQYQLNQISLETLQPGHYFIRIDMDNEKSYSSRFYKQ